MTIWLVPGAATVGDETSLGWDVSQSNSENLLVIAVRIILIVLALVVTFPGGKRQE